MSAELYDVDSTYPKYNIGSDTLANYSPFKRGKSPCRLAICKIILVAKWNALCVRTQCAFEFAVDVVTWIVVPLGSYSIAEFAFNGKTQIT